MATVQKWGGSLGVRIPSNIAKNFKINDGTQVEVKEVDGAIIIKPVYEEPSIDEMLKQITPENLHESTDVDAVGKERL